MDGLGYGDNTKAAVIRLGLMETVAFCTEFYNSNLSIFYTNFICLSFFSLPFVEFCVVLHLVLRYDFTIIVCVKFLLSIGMRKCYLSFF